MMAKEKRLKPLGSYLRRLNKPAPRNEEVLAMFRDLARKGEGVKIKRVTRARNSTSLEE